MADRTTEEALIDAWQTTKAACDPSGWTVSDSAAYRGFFAHGFRAALQWQAEQQKGFRQIGWTCGDGDCGRIHESPGADESYAQRVYVAATPHGVPPQPSSIQQRAIYLHEKAAMPWPDAEELALNEAGIDARAIDELIGECGYAGLASMLCTDDELRRFTRSVLVHQPASSLPQAPQGEQG